MIASRDICVHCGGEIEAGQRWVREKAYERALAGVSRDITVTILNSSTDTN